MIRCVQVDRRVFLMLVAASAVALTTGCAGNRPEGSISVADFASLRDAINALPAGGGTIWVPAGRWPSGTWTIESASSKPGVRIVGERSPQLNADASALDGGSIIEGRFYAWADNIEVTDVGFDAGKRYMERMHPDADYTTYTHPDGGGWDTFAIVKPPARQHDAAIVGVRVDNVIGLLPHPTAFGHGILIECVDQAAIGTVTGVGGVHAVALKATQSKVAALHGYGASGNGVILKSDWYAPTGNLSIDRVRTASQPPDVEPWWGSYKPAVGLHINPETADTLGGVTVGSLAVTDSRDGIAISGPKRAESLTIRDAQLLGGPDADAAVTLHDSTMSAMTVDQLGVTQFPTTIRWDPSGDSSLRVTDLTVDTGKPAIDSTRPDDVVVDRVSA